MTAARKVQTPFPGAVSQTPSPGLPSATSAGLLTVKVTAAAVGKASRQQIAPRHEIDFFETRADMPRCYELSGLRSKPDPRSAAACIVATSLCLPIRQPTQSHRKPCARLR